MLPNHGLSQASLRLCSVLRQLELPDFDGLISLMHAPAMERTLHGLVVEELIAPQTFFFERYEIFKGLRHSILPKLMAQKTGQEKTLRIWVPNCRRGQDAHSLAIMFNEAMPELKNWDIEIWATAPKGDELAQARSGKFSAAQVANGLPAGLKRKSFSPHANHFRVQARHRRLVEFYRLALHEPWNKLCQFDVIFLRNSLSYMPAYDKAKLLDRLGQQLTPEGVLLFGDGAQNIVHPHFESSPELPTHSLNQREPMTLASTRQTTALQSASCMQAEHPAESDTGEIDFREILDAVRDLDLFTLMSIQDVETICRNMEVVKYKSGATLMREGDVSSNFFVVLEGELRVTMRTTFGRPNRELAVLGAGEVVGEMSHLLNLPCNATVKALGTWHLPRATVWCGLVSATLGLQRFLQRKPAACGLLEAFRKFTLSREPRPKAPRLEPLGRSFAQCDQHQRCPARRNSRRCRITGGRRRHAHSWETCSADQFIRRHLYSRTRGDLRPSDSAQCPRQCSHIATRLSR